MNSKEYNKKYYQRNKNKNKEDLKNIAIQRRKEKLDNYKNMKIIK